MIFIGLTPFVDSRIEQWRDEDLRGLQNVLLATPDAGDVIPGGSGLRKLRWPAWMGRAGLPRDYAATLGAIKRRIRQERLRVVLAGNSAMVLSYCDIGQLILDGQERAGRGGAKAIDRLSADLRAVYSDMQGLSPRNLKVHACLRCSVARARDRSKGRCTIALAPELRPRSNASTTKRQHLGML